MVCPIQDSPGFVAKRDKKEGETIGPLAATALTREALFLRTQEKMTNLLAKVLKVRAMCITSYPVFEFFWNFLEFSCEN